MYLCIGSRLLTASWDKSVALWDINSSETLLNVCHCYTLSPKADFTFIPFQWDAKQSSLLMSCDLCSVHQLAVAAADSGHYHTWDLRSGLEINTIKGIKV